MNLTSLTDVRGALDALGIRPSRRLGQNFLVDANILRLLLREAAIGRDDGVLEVGPGLGVVTRELLRVARRVLAVERDGRLAAHLAETLPDAGKADLDLRHMDALDLDCENLPGRGYRLMVSNLPYAVGSRVLVNLADALTPPERMVVTVQREVADRLAAGPDGKDYGLLTVRVRRAFDVRLVHVVGRRCFWPPPAVESAIVCMDRRHGEGAEFESADERERFRRLTRDAFAHRRKQLAPLLPTLLPERRCSADAWRRDLAAMGLDERCRPESLSPSHWMSLCAL